MRARGMVRGAKVEGRGARLAGAAAMTMATMLVAALPLAAGDNPCTDQPVHSYGSGLAAGGRSATVTFGRAVGTGAVTVADTNTTNCDPANPAPADWDGDHDAGVGGAFFGYGAWANDPDCDYDLNVHGPNVVVNDALFGSFITFVTGEDDQSGPLKIQNPVDGSWACDVSGAITPGLPLDPATDPDDCLSQPYLGVGATCGSGGGDGGYWVFLHAVFVDENPAQVDVRNPPTTGTITAF